jgi:hypothetical protein
MSPCSPLCQRWGYECGPVFTEQRTAARHLQQERFHTCGRRALRQHQINSISSQTPWHTPRERPAATLDAAQLQRAPDRLQATSRSDCGRSAPPRAARRAPCSRAAGRVARTPPWTCGAATAPAHGRRASGHRAGQSQTRRDHTGGIYGSRGRIGLETSLSDRGERRDSAPRALQPPASA